MIGAEDLGEVGHVRIAHGVGGLRGGQALLEQLLGPAHALVGDVLLEADAGRAADDPADLLGGDAAGLRDGIQADLVVHGVLLHVLQHDLGRGGELFGLSGHDGADAAYQLTHGFPHVVRVQAGQRAVHFLALQRTAQALSTLDELMAYLHGPVAPEQGGGIGLVQAVEQLLQVFQRAGLVALGKALADPVEHGLIVLCRMRTLLRLGGFGHRQGEGQLLHLAAGLSHADAEVREAIGQGVAERVVGGQQILFLPRAQEQRPAPAAGQLGQVKLDVLVGQGDDLTAEGLGGERGVVGDVGHAEVTAPDVQAGVGQALLQGGIVLAAQQAKQYLLAERVLQAGDALQAFREGGHGIAVLLNILIHCVGNGLDFVLIFGFGVAYLAGQPLDGQVVLIGQRGRYGGEQERQEHQDSQHAPDGGGAGPV